MESSKCSQSKFKCKFLFSLVCGVKKYHREGQYLIVLCFVVTKKFSFNQTDLTALEKAVKQNNFYQVELRLYFVILQKISLLRKPNLVTSLLMTFSLSVPQSWFSGNQITDKKYLISITSLMRKTGIYLLCLLTLFMVTIDRENLI